MSVQPFIGKKESVRLHRLQAQEGPHLSPPRALQVRNQSFRGDAFLRQLTEAVMRDEIFDREYQAGRDSLHSGIDRLISSMAKSLRVLNSIQFDAPWKHDAEASTRPAR
jgi:hypothetical protein